MIHALLSDPSFARRSAFRFLRFPGAFLFKLRIIEILALRLKRKAKLLGSEQWVFHFWYIFEWDLGWRQHCLALLPKRCKSLGDIAIVRRAGQGVNLHVCIHCKLWVRYRLRLRIFGIWQCKSWLLLAKMMPKGAITSLILIDQATSQVTASRVVIPANCRATAKGMTLPWGPRKIILYWQLRESKLLFRLNLTCYHHVSRGY